jgi:hypothetical protein
MRAAAAGGVPAGAELAIDYSPGHSGQDPRRQR